MSVPEIFQTIEQTGFSRWIRDSPSIFGFYFILLCHTIGLSLLVGGNAIIALRILGIVSGFPLKPLKEIYRFMWVGLGINIITGLLLLTAYPTKALTNYDFYFKMSCIILGLITMVKILKRVFSDPSLSEVEMIARGKTLAKYSLFFWIAAIWAGRMLSETSTYLMYGLKTK